VSTDRLNVAVARASFRSMKSFNLYGDEWDETRDREGWRIKEAFVGHRIGGGLIGASMSEVEPGNKLWPYHTHHANEEWVIVLRGDPTLRTPGEEHALTEGDVVAFPRGKDGAHQIINRTDAPVRVLMLSSMVGPDVINYIDTGKVYAKDHTGEPIMFSRPGPTVDYWEGED
jgi:uncharacterized cupin superfamily protein